MVLKKIPVLGNLIILAYRKINRKPTTYFDVPTTWIEKLLQEEEINIVQIGSNDGVSGDPINRLIKEKSKWNALFVEPIPYLFNKLKNNYGPDPRFSFENVAINDGYEQVFYSIKEEAKSYIPNLPFWYDQLGSFDKENILKHLDGVLEPYIEETVLPGITLEQLFKRNNIHDLSLLHIDTEGYDWKILSQLDLSRFNPKIILFEQRHLTKTEKKESVLFLRSKYSIFELGSDLICIHNNLVNKDHLNELHGKQIV